MKTAKDLVLSVTLIVLVTTGLCFGQVGNAKGTSELAKQLRNDANEGRRVRAAGKLGKQGDISAKDVLLDAAFKDSSFEVRIRAMRAASEICDRETQRIRSEYRKGVRNKESAQKEELRLKSEMLAPLQVYLDPGYQVGTGYENDVRSSAARSLMAIGDDPKVVDLGLEALKANCAISLAERAKKESPHWQGKGDGLTLNLIALIRRPRIEEVRRTDGFTYSRNRNREMAEGFAKELAVAQGDYKYSLLIILGKIGMQKELNIETLEQVPVYDFGIRLLKECEQGLLRTESEGIKWELVQVMRSYGYTPNSAQARIIMDDLIAESRKEVREKSGHESKKGGRY